MKRFLVAVLVFAITFAVPVSILTFIDSKKSTDYDDRTQAEQLQEDKSDNFSIVSSPPDRAQTGSVYQYKIKVNRPSLDVEYTVLTGPEWLSLAENGLLKGIPGDSDLGEMTVKIRANAGQEWDTQEYRLFVEKGADSVLGETDDADSGSEAVLGAGDDGSSSSPVSSLALSSTSSLGPGGGLPNTAISPIYVILVGILSLGISGYAYFVSLNPNPRRYKMKFGNDLDVKQRTSVIEVVEK